MTSELKVGLVGEVTHRVTAEDTAARWGSGLVEAYSTPALVVLIEKAAVNALEKCLSSTLSSVGVEVNLKHLAATPMGMQVKARAELVAIDGRRLTFNINAWDVKEKICEGTLLQVLVEKDRFFDRLIKKAGRRMHKSVS